MRDEQKGVQFTERMKLLQREYLERLYELAFGSEVARVKAEHVSDILSFESLGIGCAGTQKRDITQGIQSYLEREGLINLERQGYIQITHKGIKEMEQSNDEPDMLYET